MSKILELRSKRNTLWEQTKAFLEQHRRENGLVAADAVEQYNKGADAVMALTQGKVDAVIIDNEPAKSFVASNEGLKILETEYAVEDYAACINKENDALLEKVNEAIKELKDDGTLQKIMDKYITAD